MLPTVAKLSTYWGGTTNGLRLKRVVITGIGAVSPLGLTLTESWNGLLQKKTGVDTLERAIRAQYGLLLISDNDE